MIPNINNRIVEATYNRIFLLTVNLRTIYIIFFDILDRLIRRLKYTLGIRHKKIYGQS